MKTKYFSSQRWWEQAIAIKIFIWLFGKIKLMKWKKEKKKSKKNEATKIDTKTYEFFDTTVRKLTECWG